MKIQTKPARSRWLVGILMFGLILVAGCGGKDKAADSGKTGSSAADASAEHLAQSQAAPMGAPAPESMQSSGNHGGVANLAGVKFLVPPSWQDLGPDGMRKAQYRIDPVEGDKAPAEVNVYYFGPQSGGGVQANLNRWIGQMILPDGADPDTAIERSEFTTDGMPGHVVALNGSYKSGGGRPMGGGGEVLPDYRLVGVVIEGPQGSVFFKLTGPEKTASAMEPALMQMVKTARD